MLSQIVRPMVRTQIRLLANSQATHSTLVDTISQWLGFLGVQAHVTHLTADSNQIHVSLTVNKPEACDTVDWKQILEKLNQAQKQVQASSQAETLTSHFTPQQARQFQRLLAYVIQVGAPDQARNWADLQPELQNMGFDEETLLGIRSALKVPQSLPLLMEELDPDVAAVALPKAVSIALLDRQVNPHEDQALDALLQAMRQPVSN